MFRWIRVSPTYEAPLCGSDECVIAWHPPRGWPNPTTRKLRKERYHDPLFVLKDSPRADALLAEIDTLAVYGRIRADPMMYELVRAALNLLIETATTGLPSNPYREVPAFRILDLARAMRQTLHDSDGELDRHLLECQQCALHLGRRARMCDVGLKLYIAEQGLEFPQTLS